VQAKFIISAFQPEQFPEQLPGVALPEIAFLGRSNVGKSSLLNALAGIKGLAHTSATPGRTQCINFFHVDESWCFVDLPGYGYARVPKEITKNWKPLIEAYLEGRKSLEMCCLLLDARRGWMEMDLELSRWLRKQKRRCLVIATKFDKLKTQKLRYEALTGIKEHLGDFSLITSSTVTGQGVREIWQAIKTIQRQ